MHSPTQPVKPLRPLQNFGTALDAPNHSGGSSQPKSCASIYSSCQLGAGRNVKPGPTSGPACIQEAPASPVHIIPGQTGPFVSPISQRMRGSGLTGPRVPKTHFGGRRGLGMGKKAALGVYLKPEVPPHLSHAPKGKTVADWLMPTPVLTAVLPIGRRGTLLPPHPGRQDRVPIPPPGARRRLNRSR